MLYIDTRNLNIPVTSLRNEASASGLKSVAVTLLGRYFFSENKSCVKGKGVNSGESVGILKYNILNFKISSSHSGRLVNFVLSGHDNVKFDKFVQALSRVLLSLLSA